ncbi:unnamed protein product [Dibothriocephalus latus]|uniref:Uncharacterized protein n=1 Tax=Dibothriocephalus latus TaxID=60516 RepID=A0A3P7NS74_DIBLA|nr:unnamed protein product [Dibothriocephalus latus]
MKYDKFLRELSHSVTNPLLDSLPSVNGIPRNAFLYRFAAVSPFTTTRKLNMSSYLDGLISLLSEATEEGRESSRPPATSCEKYDALRQLREIAASEKYSAQIYSEIVIEACFTIAFLARRFHFELYDEMDSLIGALVRMVAVGMVPLENHVTLYREEADRHKDREMVSSRPLAFHFPRMRVKFAESQQRMVGIFYYTIADLLYSLPWPKLILFFECRIFRRKEMTRSLLFGILTSICMNLRELRSETDRLSKITPLPEADSAATARLWEDLPANMYLELLRAYALRVFEYYFQGTTEEKVQFGRGSVHQHGRKAGRKDSSGKPSSSNIQEDTVGGSQASGKRSDRKKGLGSGRGNDSVTDGRNKTQKSTVEDVASEEKEAENEEEDDYDELISDGEVDFTTTRKTIIPGRLPDIFQIHRASR